jgi:voltage-gated potassium channel
MILGAVVSYVALGWEWLDALYMVVITVGTIGFTDQPSTLSPAEKLLTIGVVILGVTVVAYIFAGFVQMITAGELQKALGLYRMNREIDQLENHVIICGAGRTGRMLAEELERGHSEYVIIDREAKQHLLQHGKNCLFVEGDATEEDILLRAGVQRAKSLVSALPHDAENVFITLTARNLNPKLQIIARAEQFSTNKKLLQAGANRVVMPASIGAQRMAAMITRPSTVEFLELVADRNVLDVELDEFLIPAASPLIGKKLGETGIRPQYSLLLVAVKRRIGMLIFNPEPDYVFQPEDVAIIMGRTEDIQRFRDECKLCDKDP